MMRSAVDPCGLDEILATQEQACGLRSADALAAAVGDEGRAVLQVHVRHGQDLGGGVDEREEVVRRIGLAAGMVDTKTCAIDRVLSGPLSAAGPARI